MTNSATLSQQFLHRLHEMNPDAWKRLVESFSPAVYAWCRQAGLDGHDAADVVQDVFATLSRKISQFDYERPQASFRAWLSTITLTRLADYFRRAARQPNARVVPKLWNGCKPPPIWNNEYRQTLELHGIEYEPDYVFDEEFAG
jgi:RNA polymerase sigma factor (sigma-70 family)